MMGYIVWYILCVLVWGFAQEGLKNAGMLIIPAGQSRAYLLGGGALLMMVTLLIGHTAVDSSETGHSNAPAIGGVVVAAAAIGLMLLAFAR